MKKSIKYILFGIVLGICVTITYISMKTVLSMQSALVAHEKALNQIVGYINTQIAKDKSENVLLK